MYRTEIEGFIDCHRQEMIRGYLQALPDQQREDALYRRESLTEGGAI